MPANGTAMTIGNNKFTFDFDTGELQISQADLQMSFDLDEAQALGDFLFEVLSVKGYPPRILPLKITSVESASEGS